MNTNVEFPQNWFNILKRKISCAITRTQEKLSSFDSEPKFSLRQESSAFFLKSPQISRAPYFITTGQILAVFMQN